MAVKNVEVTCDGASGTAAPFVVKVSGGGQSIAQTDVTGQPVPETGGEWWEWSLSWKLEGKQTVTLTDWTHMGAQSWVIGTYELDCPVPTTLAPTTTENVATVPSLVVDPSVPTTAVQTADPSVPTTVALTWPGPPTTNYESLDGFYNASETTAVVQERTENTLPATGAASGPMLGAGFGALVLGVACARLAARPRRVAS